MPSHFKKRINLMTDTVKKPNRTALFIIAWIGLFIFNFLFARLTTTVPVSVIALFMLFTSVALYKERVQLRGFAVIGLFIAVVFICITYFGTIWLRYEVRDLLNVGGPRFFQIYFYLFMFMNAAAFTTIAMGLFKAISTMRGMFINFVLTAIIYFAISYSLKDVIAVLMQLTAQMPQG